MLIINDTNWKSIVDQQLQSGWLLECQPRRTAYGQHPLAAPRAERKRPYPRSEWLDRARFNDENKLWPADLLRAKGVPPRSQNGLSYCWAWSLTATLEILDIRRSGAAVELAPESLGGDVNWRNAGNYLDSAIAYAAENGICERSFVPLHTIDPRKFATGWQQNALLRCPAEWYDIGDGGQGTWDSQVSALLDCEPQHLGYDWWRHAVAGVQLVHNPSSRLVFDLMIWNSHGDGFVLLQGERAVASMGSFSPRAMTRRA